MCLKMKRKKRTVGRAGGSGGIGLALHDALHQIPDNTETKHNTNNDNNNKKKQTNRTEQNKVIMALTL